MNDAFPPTPQAARARLAALDPQAYAATRNHLDGAVSRLSPYVTHGFVTLPEVWAGTGCQPAGHKWTQELGWRAFFRHAWQHRGDAIFASLHEGPLPDAAYARELPDDLREGRTGVPVIDHAVRSLYATGWLHNHVRLWLAAYLVHERQVHWRSGADWLYTHLLDGDLASNHLSWQWVAGTGSSKPYRFDADNVRRFAPPSWHAEAPPGPRVTEPAARSQPPCPTQAPDASQVAGRDVWLVHAWSLADPPPDRTAIAVLDADFHARWPWSDARWRFVGARLQALGMPVWWAPAASVVHALAAARSVRAIADPHARELIAGATCDEPMLFSEVDQPCRSFSQWWRRARLLPAG